MPTEETLTSGNSDGFTITSGSSKERPSLFFDMDGVLCDFIGGVLERFGLSTSEFADSGSSDVIGYVCRAHDRRTKDVWDDELSDAQFWSGLAPLSWGLQVINEARKREPDVYVLTSGLTSTGAAVGKLAWLKEHLPWLTRKQIILTSEKHLLAGPGRVLIDDWEYNISGWLGNGGKAIWTPCLANSEPDAHPPSISQPMGRFASRGRLGIDFDVAWAGHGRAATLTGLLRGYTGLDKPAVVSSRSGCKAVD